MRPSQLTYRFCAGMFFLMLCCFTFAQNSFEGKILISATNHEKGEKANVTWLIKNGDHKLIYSTQTKEGNFSYALLLLQNSTDVFLLADGGEKKTKYKMPASGFPKSTSILPGASVISESGTKLIAGKECKQYSIHSGEFSAVAWVGEIPGFNSTQIPTFLRNNGIAGALIAQHIQGIPLEFNIYDGNQNLISSQAVISIEPGNISEIEFEVPADYEAGN